VRALYSQTGQGRTDAANYSLETGGSYEAVIGYSSMIGEVRLYPTTGSNGGFSVNNYTAIRRNVSFASPSNMII